MGNEQNIDTLNIEVNTKAGKNSNGIDKMAESIKKLRDSVSSTTGGLGAISAAFSRLDTSIGSLKGKAGTVSSIVNSFKKLNDLDVGRTASQVSTLAKSMQSLNNMDSGLKKIISDLAQLSRSGNGNASMGALKLQAQAAKTQATVDKSALQSVKAQEGLKALNERNKAIAESAKYATEQENSLNDAVNRSMQKYNAQFRQSNSSEAAIEADAELAKQHSSSKSALSSGIVTSIADLKKAMGEVETTSTMATSKVSAGTSQATSFVDKLRNSFASTKEKVEGFNHSAHNAFALQNFYGSYFIIRKIADTMAGFITNINSYVENMNLFSVAMGKSAESGQKLSNSLQNVLGIDAGEANRYMGVFEQMTTSFGIANKQATTMSENFTQLGYDIASFYNIPTSLAFEKLQSGLAGQSRALRQLGIDTSSARLQQELYNLGFKEKVKDLSEADKAELIYIAIMKQTTNAQGDMARTIQTPANALRVLQAQLQITGRAIGSIFIPALQAVLPWITAFTEVIGEGAAALANFLGFKMPTIDYSSLKPMSTNVPNDINVADTGIKNIGKDAKESSKAVKDLIGGFDELNILSTAKESSTKGKSGHGSGTGKGGNILGGLGLPQYDALDGAVSNKVDAIKQKIKDFLNAFRNDPLTTFSQALWGMNGAFGGLFGMLTKLDYADLLNGISAACVAFGLTKNPILALAIGAIVTALSHIMPQKAKVEMLTGTLTALGGALMLSAFTGMNFKLAFGISSLVTSGLIQLVGKTAAIATLSGVIVGLGTAFAAYRLTGNVPLALAIGAVAGAVSALSVQFGHMEVAASLLIGLTTALVAIKKGMYFPAAITIGLGAFVLSIGNLANVGPTAKIALDGIGLGIIAIGAAFAVFKRMNPIIAVVAGLAGAIAGIAIGIQQVKRADEEADLKKRFGDITLSMDDCKKMADELTTTPYTVKVSAAINAEKDLENIKTTLASDIQKLDEMNWKISVGYKLDSGEQSDYKNAIDSFMKDAKEYVEKQHYTANLNIQAALMGHSDSIDKLTTITDAAYNPVEKQLNDYGKQLTELIGKGFKDGVPIKASEILAVEAKAQKALQAVADAKYKAKLKSLEIDYGKPGITADSFKKLQKDIQSSTQDKLNAAKETRVNAIATAQLGLEEHVINKKTGKPFTQADVAQITKDAESTFNQQQLEIHIDNVKVSTNTLMTSYKDALDKAAKSISYMDGFDHIADALGGGFDTAVQESTREVKNSFDNAGLTANSDLEAMIKSIKPSENDLRSQAETLKKAGKQIPDEYRKGINDTEKLKALWGSSDGINYQLGLKFSTDKGFLNTLATSQGAGKKITGYMREGLTNNTVVKNLKDSAGKTVSWICDAQGKKLVEVTPTMRDNFKAMGVNTGNWIVSGAKDKKTVSKVQSATSDLVNAGKSSAQKANAGSKELFTSIGMGWVDNLFDGLKSGLKESWSNFKNWIKEQTKGKKPLYKLPDILGIFNEKGTPYHPGGPAIVNDQQGSTYRELVAEPNGKMYIPYGRNVLLPDLPRGSKIFTASQTAMMLPHYASGAGTSNAVSVSNDAISTADLGKLNDAVERASVKRKKILDDEISYVKAKFGVFSSEMLKNADKTVTDLTADTQKIKDDSATKWDSISQYLMQKQSGISASTLKQFGLVYTYESQFFSKAQSDSEKRADDMQTHISSRFKSISDSSKTYFNTLAAGISNYMGSANTSVDKYSKQIANNISTRIGGAINGVVVGINSVLTAVGSSTKVNRIAIPAYKYGSGFHPGGAAIVNDQRGSTYRELIQYPDGRMYIPKGRNVLIPDLPRGSAVLPAAQTKRLFPHYAAGTGDFFGTSAEDMKKKLIDYIFAVKDPKKIMQTAVDTSTKKQAINEPWMSMETSTVKYLTNMSATALKGLIKKFIEQSNGTAEALLRVASSQVGNTNPTAYWKEFGSAGDQYCAEFVSWALKHAGIKEGYGSYVPSMMDWYKQRQRWTNIPDRGDLVFYDWNGDQTPDHIGIVESVMNGIVNTIEGNTTGSHGENGVFKKQRTMGKDILGYALPMFAGSDVGYGANFTGSGVGRWRSLATKALQMTGHYSSHNVDLLLRQMNKESSGQVNPADYKDVNYYAGHPSKGLMQLIPETFGTYAMPGHNSDILDPLSNILAAIRYTWSRYGSPDGVWGEGHGYSAGTGKIRWHKNGGVVNNPTPLDYAGEDGPERVVPLSEDSEWIDRVAEATAVKTEEHSNSESNSMFFSMLRTIITAALREEGGGDVTVPVTVNVGDEQLTEHVNKVNRKNQQRGRA